MNPSANQHVANIKEWLSERVFPLWSTVGYDDRVGAFAENLSMKGEALPTPKRAMVQARQIYAFHAGLKMGVVAEAVARPKILSSAHFLDRAYSQVDGSVINAVDAQRQPSNPHPDLYTQAFALFAWAEAFESTKDVGFKARAKRLLAYLHADRRAPGGGYVENKGAGPLYQSNPHMHLFEAALVWMKVDAQDEGWRALADELVSLCKNHFVTKDGILAEHFDAEWRPQTENGRYLFEPGHHFEWAWLLKIYDELTGGPHHDLRHHLYRLATEHGVDPERHAAFDEVWSDFKVKKPSSRFWPQTERIKAAVRLGAEQPAAEQANFAREADEAMTALFRYLDTVVPGLWRDTWYPDGSFNDEPARASSLYHIINAMYEYTVYRPQLKDA